MKKLRNTMIPLRKSSIIAFSLSLILLILTYVASQWLILKIEKDNFVQEMQANTKEHLSFAKTLFDSIVTDLQFTVTALQNCESIWQPEAKEILKLSHRLNFCDATFISDMSGDAIAHTGEVFSIANQDFFQDALQSPSLTFSDILPSQRFGAIQIISLPIFARVHGQQEPVGYLFGLYDVKRFSRTIDARHDSGKYIYIVDSHGTYINSFSENQDLSGDRNFWDDFALVNMEGTTIEEMEKNFHAEAEGDFSYSHGDVRRYGYHMPLGIKDWQIVLSIDESIVDSRVETLSTVATTATIINWICLGVMLWCISSYFISANQKMRKINQDISKNHEMIKIATESSNRVIFEYSIPQKRIEFKTSFTHPLFHDSVLFCIPERLIQMHAVEKDSVPALRDLFRRIEHENSCQADIQVVWSADKMIWCRITLQNLYGENGDIISTVGCIENIDMLKQGEEAIKRKLEIHKSLIKNSLLYGRLNLSSGMIVELNGSNVSISYTDYLSQHASRYVCIEYLSYVMQSLSLDSLREAYHQDKEYLEVQFEIPANGSTKWISTLVYRVHESAENIITFVMRDIDQRKREELALKERAEIDGLTRLYNAATTRSKIHALLSQPHHAEEKQIFILFDLDNFKKINDTFGHSVGDQVLVDMANILKKHFRSTDIVGRLGGDEFVAMVCDVKSELYYIENIVDSLRADLVQTYTEGDISIVVSASMGIAVSPQDGTTFKELYKNADAALYEVKKQGKNGYKRWSEQ